WLFLTLLPALVLLGWPSVDGDLTSTLVERNPLFREVLAKRRARPGFSIFLWIFNGREPLAAGFWYG
ncbi:MAG: hypothetical protein WAL80_08125, partial [Xanthobacteraceae bacterium]